MMAESSPGEPSHDKRAVRPDVAARKASRKENEEFVVKASLSKYLVKDAKTPLIIQALRSRIDSVSKKTVMASRALCCLVKELFDGEDDVSSVKVPDIFNITFFRQLMLGIEDCHKPYKAIEAFFERHPEMRDKGGRIKGDRNSFCHAATKYVTNLKNNFKMRFMSRLQAYLKALETQGRFTQDERIVVLYDIMGWKRPEDRKAFVVTEDMSFEISLQRKILGVEDGQEVTEDWLDKNHESVLKQWVFFMKSEALSPFNLVPINKVRHHFVTIDNEVFKYILLEVGLINEVNTADLKELWPTIIKYDKVMRKESKATFTGTIDTDGTSICMHFKRPKQQPSTKQEQEIESQKTKELFKDPSYRKLGCDPGRATIYSIVEELPDEKVKKYTLTREQYYNDSGVFKARRQTERWEKRIQDELATLSTVTTKGIDVNEHLEFQETFLNLFPRLWSHYTDKRWAEQRLRLYGGKKRVMARFWNKVLGKETERGPTVLAYGASKFAPGGKGEISVPTTSAFNVAKRQNGLRILLVDEFRSTRVDYRTEKLLDQVQIEGQEKPLRGLLWCGSTIKNKKQGTLVSRDVNAALNILKCARSESRPDIMDRKKNKQALPSWIVGKIFKACKFK